MERDKEMWKNGRGEEGEGRCGGQEMQNRDGRRSNWKGQGGRVDCRERDQRGMRGEEEWEEREEEEGQARGKLMRGGEKGVEGKET